MAEEASAFAFGDVVEAITTKLIRRHPHVFGDARDLSPEEVRGLWDSIKAAEKAARVPADGGEAVSQGLLDGVARALPALPASREIQDRASSLGWDWDSIGGVWEKVAEEVDELRAAERTEDQLHEIGDVLFAFVNLARWMKVDPEEALREANHRWVARYRRVEALAAERGLDLDVMSLAEKDELWDEVKAG
jgi:ATP diphosphatase